MTPYRIQMEIVCSCDKSRVRICLPLSTICLSPHKFRRTSFRFTEIAATDMFSSNSVENFFTADGTSFSLHAVCGPQDQRPYKDVSSTEIK